MTEAVRAVTEVTQHEKGHVTQGELSESFLEDVDLNCVQNSGRKQLIEWRTEQRGTSVLLFQQGSFKIR